MRPLLALYLCTAAVVGGGCDHRPTASPARVDAAGQEADAEPVEMAAPPSAPAPDAGVPDGSPGASGAPDLDAIIGRARGEVESRLGPPEGTAGIWVRYAGGLSIAYNRGVAVRVRTRLEGARSCAEAGRRLGFDRAEPSRSGGAGGSTCVLERPPDGRFRGSVVGRLGDGVFTVRPVSRSSCGNELLR